MFCLGCDIGRVAIEGESVGFMWNQIFLVKIKIMLQSTYYNDNSNFKNFQNHLLFKKTNSFAIVLLSNASESIGKRDYIWFDIIMVATS